MKDTNTDATYETWLSKYGGYANGMTLRDYFAAKAMQGLLANSQLPADPSGEKLALVVYAIADHMLKARNAAQ
jgi:hypothetical protein